MSNDPEQEYFADGIAEDIITALSHIKQWFVVARNSSFAYKGRNVDIREVARELGVHYVLEGSVRKGVIDYASRASSLMRKLEDIYGPVSLMVISTMSSHYRTE